MIGQNFHWKKIHFDSFNSEKANQICVCIGVSIGPNVNSKENILLVYARISIEGCVSFVGLI